MAMASSESEVPKQRINMAHGFMKSVIKNQIDRDNYDKEVKAKQHHVGSHRPRPGPNKSKKKPEIQAYVPPQRAKKESYLYTLEYEHKNGAVFKVPVLKTDSAQTVALRVGSKFSLSEPYVQALAQRVQEEMNKRLG